MEQKNTTSNKQIGYKRQQQIIKYLTKWQYSTIKIIAQNLDLTYAQAQSNVTSLINKNHIKIHKFYRTGELVNLVFLTEIGIATNLKLLSSKPQDNEYYRKLLDEIQAIYLTATSPDQINDQLLNHNLYLQELIPQIKQNLLEYHININKYRTELEQSALHKKRIQDQLYQLESEYQILKKNNQNREEIGWKIQETKQNIQNLKAKFADLIINNNIAIEFENSRKKPRELDQMYLKYAANSSITQVFIFSFSSLNVYKNHLANEFHFSWKYSAKNKKYEAVSKHKLNEEQRQKFIFVEVN